MKHLPRRVTAFGAAKVNVGWRVGARHRDGYHEVTGVIQTISLGDRLVVECGEDYPPGTGGVVVDIGGSPLRLIASDASLEIEDNLVMRAARVLTRRAEPRPTTIDLHKAIPVAAGLGGGSADAGATLAALNVLWGARLTPSELVRLGAEVGSDVPALVVGGLVHVSGRGERVRRIGATDGYAFVLGISAERISAAEAYEVFDSVGAEDGGSLHHNDLEAAACSIVPALRERIEAMRTAAGNAFVTGSGPTVVAVVDPVRAGDVTERVRSHFAATLVATPVDWGVRLVMGEGGS